MIRLCGRSEVGWPSRYGSISSMGDHPEGVSPASMLRHLAEGGWTLDDRVDSGTAMWRHPGSDAPELSYPEDVRESLFTVEDTSWWFRARNQVIESVLTANVADCWILEIGAGNGSVAAALARSGYAVVAVEPSPAGCEMMARRGVPIVVEGELDSLHLMAGTVPVIGLFDVIEHLEDDATLLREVYRVLSPSGCCLVTVPAYQWLWSQADDAAGHFRRYSLQMLDRSMMGNGFEAVFRSYFFTLATLPMFLIRSVPYRLGRREPLEQVEARSVSELSKQSSVGTIAARFEARRLAARGRLPFGTSIIGLYRRR